MATKIKLTEAQKAREARLNALLQTAPKSPLNAKPAAQRRNDTVPASAVLRRAF